MGTIIACQRTIGVPLNQLMQGAGRKEAAHK